MAALIDSSVGMGYGTLTPFMIFLGYRPVYIVPILLISQMVTGFSATLFHSVYGNVEIETDSRDTKVTLLFTLAGMVGVVVAMFFAIGIPEIFVMIYISIMLVAVGIIMIIKIRFKFSWAKLYLISGISAFNKAVSGGGYGPIATTGQIMAGREVKNAVAVTEFSEAFISGFTFLLYFIYFLIFGYPQLFEMIIILIIMSVSGAIAAPIGALITKKIPKKKGRKVIGGFSIALGVITLLRSIFNF
jgi:hypothetical protein